MIYQKKGGLNPCVVRFHTNHIQTSSRLLAGVFCYS
nr:MAG TPA: hypothetical protein [Caudoviricetes sp.]